MSSPFLARRSRYNLNETVHKVLAFRLRQEWFALLIETVEKIIPLNHIYGDPHRTGVGLTPYQGRELLVLDVSHRIFGEAPGSDLAASWNNQAMSRVVDKPPQQRYLLLLQNATGESVGMPIDSLPSIRSVPQSSFTSIPESYLAQGNLKCLSSLMIQVSGHPPLFLLAPEQLTQPKQLVGSWESYEL